MECKDCVFGGAKVPYKGDISSPFVIVGESPGIMELADGKPFVGPSGKLLDEVLAPYKHLLPEKILVTNAFSCFPRQSDPKKKEAAAIRCNGRLLSEIRMHPRQVILTLGGSAICSLIGDYNKKITRIRGQVFASDLASCGIVAAVHPAFLLRGGGNIQQFKRDVQMAVEMYCQANGKEMTVAKSEVPITSSRGMQISGAFKPGKYTIVSSKKQRDRIISDLQDGKFKYCAADIETEGFNPRRETLDKIEFTGQGILCMGVCYEQEHTWVVPYEFMEPEMFENDAKWCWHNGKFDISWLRHYGFPKARVDDDTMLLSYLLNERGGMHDLEQVGSDWLQAPNYKAMLDKYLPSRKHSYAHIPKDVLYKYQAIDTNLTFCLRDTLRSRVMEDKKLSRVYTDILIPASEFLHRVEVYGFTTDLNKVAENEIRLQGEADRFEKVFEGFAKLNGLSGLNIRSPQQVAGFIYGKLKLAPADTSTDFDTVEKLKSKYEVGGRTYNILKALLDYRGVHKLLTTYVIATRLKTDPTDGRVHTTFKLHGTTTGRLSSNKPNMQNVPREPWIRSQWIAPKGRVLLDIDLGQAELRMLACLSGDIEMIRIFLSGVSLHDEVAEYLFGKGFNKEQKMIAKNINFGIIYGIMAPGLQEQIMLGAMLLGSTIVVTRKQCQEWIDGWFRRFPQAADYINRCRLAPVRGQTLISFTGRKRRFGVVSRESLHHLQNEAANFPHQSGAHDITLLAGIATQDELAKKYDCYYVNEVHDNLIAELPDDMSLIIPAAQLIMNAMKDIPRAWGLTEVPFESDAQIGTKWEEDVIKFKPFDPKFANHKKLKGISYVQLLHPKAA